MAMARLIAQTLSHHKPTIMLPTPGALLHHRHSSGKAHIIELDLDSSSSSSSASEGLDVETINGSIKKLDEVIHSIVVRRATPDWLPFLPGYSFWIPHTNHGGSSSRGGLVEVIGKLSTASRNESLSSDDIMPAAIDSMPLRGWPSSSFFIQGVAPAYPFPGEVEVEIKIHNNSERVPVDGDEEG